MPSSVAVADHPVLHRRKHLLETLMEGPNGQHLASERQYRFHASRLGEGGDAAGEVAVHAPQQYGMDLSAVLDRRNRGLRWQRAKARRANHKQLRAYLRLDTPAAPDASVVQYPLSA